ncbi:lanthionine synthetase C family protein [Streptomyces luteireticuli]|uniref:lanthionine synthetase C family protein n=1 Tax=Streptomyces luteireticuli TaxID=173858 RepID=UPI00355683CE
MSDGKWTPVLPGETAEAVLRLAVALAGRPRATPTRVRPGLADGGAGMALVYHQLDRCDPDAGWRAMADGYLAAAARGAARLGTADPGLHSGLSGLAFAARLLPGRHPEVPAALDARVVDAAVREAGRLAAGVHGVACRAYDVISGLAGTGAHLLCRAGDVPAADAALRAVLAALVELGEERAGVPHWFTPAGALHDPQLRDRFPDGALNCGLSHGIAGPLGLMSLSLTAGVRVPGQERAVRRAADFLLEHRTDDAWGADWPGITALPGSSAGSVGARHGSWCYGAPGIARSLWLAGTALGDASLREVAVEAMKAVHRRPAGLLGLDGTPGLCHGLAGLLQITLRFAHDTGDPDFARAAAGLAVRLLRLPDRGGSPAQDGPGFLEGAAGVVLALLSAATDAVPSWDRVLLLA